MAIDFNSRVVRSSDLMSTAVADGLVMMNVDSGKYYALNNIATAVWERLETPITVEDLCAGLMEVFDVTPDRCAEEVFGFLGALQLKGMVHVVE